MFDVDLAGRVRSFDIEAALAYPEIAGGRKQGGKPISQIDAQIAAIVRSRGARLRRQYHHVKQGFGAARMPAHPAWADSDALLSPSWSFPEPIFYQGRFLSGPIQ